MTLLKNRLYVIEVDLDGITAYLRISPEFEKPGQFHVNQKVVPHARRHSDTLFNHVKTVQSLDKATVFLGLKIAEKIRNRCIRLSKNTYPKGQRLRFHIRHVRLSNLTGNSMAKRLHPSYQNNRFMGKLR